MGLAILLAAGFALFWACLVALTLRALRCPPRRTFAWCVSRGEPADPGALSPPRAFEERSITITTGAGRDAESACWIIGGDSPTGPTLVYCHGWAESRQTVLLRLGALLPVCSRVIAWDLPGHGEAAPGCSRLGVDEHLPLLALLDEAAPEGRVVLQGFSLGAGVCIRAAAERPERIAGVVAEAPYRLPWTPARDVMRLRGFPFGLNLRPALFLAGLRLAGDPLWRRFDRAVLAAQVGCPLLVLHGVLDTMCPIEDGRAISRAPAFGRLAEIPGTAHLDMWTRPESAALAGEALRSFLRQLDAPSPAGQ